MTFAVIKAREELRAAALRVLSAEHLDHSGAHDAAEQEYADDQLAVAALHLTAAVAASGDPMDRPAAGWEPETLSDGFHTFAELYEHRHALFCALVRLAPELTVWRTRLHEDGSMYPGMFLAGIALPDGDVSYHLPDRCWDLLPGVRELDRAPHFDGYTPADVVDRLNAWRPRPPGSAELLEDEDGAPFPEEVQAAHRLALDEARREAAAAAVRAYVGGTAGWEIAARIERGEVQA